MRARLLASRSNLPGFSDGREMVADGPVVLGRSA
jgi:hypothetical protein